jgi:hypothetical protein
VKFYKLCCSSNKLKSRHGQNICSNWFSLQAYIRGLFSTFLEDAPFSPHQAADTNHTTPGGHGLFKSHAWAACFGRQTSSQQMFNDHFSGKLPSYITSLQQKTWALIIVGTIIVKTIQCHIT